MGASDRAVLRILKVARCVHGDGGERRRAYWTGVGTCWILIAMGRRSIPTYYITNLPVKSEPGRAGGVAASLILVYPALCQRPVEFCEPNLIYRYSQGQEAHDEKAASAVSGRLYPSHSRRKSVHRPMDVHKRWV